MPRVGAFRADHPLALLHDAVDLLVALHDHYVVGAQALVEIPPELARQCSHHDELDGGEGRVRHHHQALEFRLHEVRPGFRRVLIGDLVGADRDADEREPLRDPPAVAILGIVHHLVEAFRLERLDEIVREALR